MKFGYKNDDLGSLIKEYRIVTDKSTKEKLLFITYLDNSTSQLPLTPQFEQNVLNKMIIQAQQRDENKEQFLGEYESKRKCGIARITVDLLMSYAYYIMSLGANDTDLKKLFLGFVGFLNGLVMADGLMTKATCNKIQELKKYELYLSIMERLKEFSLNPSLYSGLAKKKIPNINTLDDYTLKEVKKLSLNLNKLERFNKYVKSSNKDN